MINKTYLVSGKCAILGVGTIVKLSNSQAKIRQSSLKKKSKDIYLVLESIQFKQGEEIIILSGNISKSLLNNLTDLSKDTKNDNEDKDQNPENNIKNSSKNQKNKSDKKVNLEKKPDQEKNNIDDINDLPNV